ncbi:MAG: hypothetical protein JNL88_10265 [Bacteroidia bacterium]|nr:hypothetical protein [Bacteroidia bacterium]
MKNLFRRILMIACAITLTGNINAQPPGARPSMEKMEDIEAMKIGFITKRLSLSPDEAKRFWPVYDQFADEMKAIRESRFSRMKDLKDDFDSMTDKDAEKAVDSEIAFRQQEVDVLKKYHAQFKQILPIKKVAKLYRAEEEFKRELLDRIREKRKDRMGPGSGPR